MTCFRIPWEPSLESRSTAPALNSGIKSSGSWFRICSSETLTQPHLEIHWQTPKSFTLEIRKSGLQILAGKPHHHPHTSSWTQFPYLWHKKAMPNLEGMLSWEKGWELQHKCQGIVCASFTDNKINLRWVTKIRDHNSNLTSTLTHDNTLSQSEPSTTITTIFPNNEITRH